MATGQAGPLGASAVQRVVTGLGLKAGPVPTQLLPREANHVREVIQIPGFAICANVQVFNDKHRFRQPFCHKGNRTSIRVWP